jgi:hypothetical protein
LGSRADLSLWRGCSMDGAYCLCCVRMFVICWQLRYVEMFLPLTRHFNNWRNKVRDDLQDCGSWGCEASTWTLAARCTKYSCGCVELGNLQRPFWSRLPRLPRIDVSSAKNETLELCESGDCTAIADTGTSLIGVPKAGCHPQSPRDPRAKKRDSGIFWDFRSEFPSLHLATYQSMARRLCRRCTGFLHVACAARVEKCLPTFLSLEFSSDKQNNAKHPHLLFNSQKPWIEWDRLDFIFI